METNLGQTEQVFREIFDEFNLYPRSIQDLMGYFRYLQYTGIGNRTLPYQFMILNEEDGEGDLDLVKAINRYIDQVFHEKRRIMSISERELLDRKENIFRDLKDTDFLVINGCIPEEMSDEDRQIWNHLSEVFERKPAIVKFLVAPRNIIYLRFRPVDHIFFRTFRNHLETIIPRNEETILFCLERILSEEGYLLTDGFKTDMEAYVRTVYPKADLKERAFLKDLVTRIKLEYYKKIKEDDQILTGEHVPFYIKDPVTEPEKDTEAEPEKDTEAEPNKDTNAEPETGNNVKDESVVKSAPAEYPLHFKHYEFSAGSDSANNNEKNVLILSMSTLPRVNPDKGQKVRSSLYWAEIPEAENADTSDIGKKQSYAFFRGISQLEAGTKYWMTRLAAAGKHLDRIIICTTPETWENVKAYDEKSAVTVYKEGILAFVKVLQSGDTVLSKIVNQSPHVTVLGEREAKDVLYRTKQAYDDDSIQSALDQLDKIDTDSIDFFDSGNDGGRQKEIEDTLFNTINKGDYTGDSMPEIRQMNQLYKQIRGVLSDDQDTRINIYLDAQGGQRTFFNLIFSLFSMQNRDIMEIKGVSAIDFDPRKPIHLIRDVTEEFQTVDLVSAVKAFSLYGRGDLLTSYYQKVNDSENTTLINSIQTIADSISISNPSDFDDGIEQLKTYMDELKAGTDELPYYFLEHEIQDKYRSLLTGPKSILKTVEWCIDNKFYQQALSFIEDKMPAYILEHFLHVSFRKVSEGSADTWHRVDQISQADNYRDLLKIIEGITKNDTFYVSTAGKVLYACFKNVKANMDQQYVEDLCKAIILRQINDENTIIKIAEKILNTKSSGQKLFAARLFCSYMASGHIMNTGNLYKLIPGTSDDLRNSNQQLSKEYIDAYGSYNDNSEQGMAHVLYNLYYGRLGDIKADKASFNNITKAFKEIIENSRNRNRYFPGVVEETLIILCKLINENNDKDAEIIKEIITVLTPEEDCDIEWLRHYCYGDFADQMNRTYSYDHDREMLNELKRKVAEQSDLEAYKQFHMIMDKLKKTGSYNSGYDDYDELVKMKDQFREIEHQGHHRNTILGMAIDYDSKKNSERPLMKDNKAGFINADDKEDDVIKLKFGPFTTDKSTNDEWNIRCDIPVRKNQNNPEKLDEFLGLHAALKQERNNCNHASERGVRLSVKGIRNMLELYTRMAEELAVFEEDPEET